MAKVDSIGDLNKTLQLRGPEYQSEEVFNFDLLFWIIHSGLEGS
jgi:hypothetical protein